MNYDIYSNCDQVERICISVNSHCNYACEYCYFFNPENRVSSEPPLNAEDIVAIMERCFEYHQKYNFTKKIKINFVGSGEPLLNWKEIAMAVSKFHQMHPKQECIKLYTVTNASLITPEIAQEMKSLKIVPSVSLDGPRKLHNANRRFPNGKGTFDATMKGISILKEAGFDVTINTTLSKNLLNNIDSFFDFVIEQGFNKVIFDRLVDVPKGIDPISCQDYYEFLSAVADILKHRDLKHIEIGNLEAYRRNFSGIPDHVCTMFGGSCGAGTHFLIYMGKNVYPCGRMFGKDQWLLGNYEQEIEMLQKQMYSKIPCRTDCLSCSVSNECVRDCLLERFTTNYSCKSRQDFLCSFQNKPN